jgi:hypothetical protein
MMPSFATAREGWLGAVVGGVVYVVCSAVLIVAFAAGLTGSIDAVAAAYAGHFVAAAIGGGAGPRVAITGAYEGERLFFSGVVGPVATHIGLVLGGVVSGRDASVVAMVGSFFLAGVGAALGAVFVIGRADRPTGI